jgi:predicted kinase
MSSRLVVLCGTAYSGKSTLAADLARRLDGRIVSLDEINERRGLWGGDGIPVEQWKATHAIAASEVREHLASGTCVILDDTSSLRFLRNGWRALAAEVGADFHLVYLDVDHATIRRRRAANQTSLHRRDVSDAVLEEHLATFEPPAPDEYAVRVRPGDPTPIL